MALGARRRFKMVCMKTLSGCLNIWRISGRIAVKTILMSVGPGRWMPPFNGLKQVASHFGGTRNALAVSWPKGMGAAAGELRDQFHHVIDLMPTVLDVVGIEGAGGRERC